MGNTYHYKFRAVKTAAGVIGLVLAAFCLFGCQRIQPMKPTEPEKKDCTVRFFYQGKAVVTQNLPAGSCPDMMDRRFSGLDRWIWRNELGMKVLPDRLPVYGDTDFYGEVYPWLSRTAAYIFADPLNQLNPDAPVTFLDFSKAAQALLPDRQMHLAAGLLHTNSAMTEKELHQSLLRYVPPEDLDPFCLNSDETVTRIEFVKIMNILTHRSPHTPIVVLSRNPWFRDLSAESENYADLLLASVNAIADNSQGWPIEEAVRYAHYSPGYFLQNGFLYLADKDGKLIRNQTCGGLAFTESGRYTSGDTQLDAMTAEILSGLQKQHFRAEREELLLAAFEYCRDTFYGSGGNHYAFGESGWETEEAKTALKVSHGNCYNFAAAFWALARNLGYDARCVSGKALNLQQEHAWVVIDMEETSYIFDTLLANQTKKGLLPDYGENMFMIPPYDAYIWKYTAP